MCHVAGIQAMVSAIPLVMTFLLFVGLAMWGILLIFVGFQETVRLFRNLFDPRALRRLMRFRLRTMLFLAAVIQAVFAAMAWTHNEGKPLALLFFTLSCMAFFAWTLWAVFEESVSQTASRRWSRYVRARHIVVPDDSGPPPPDRGDTRSTGG